MKIKSSGSKRVFTTICLSIVVTLATISPTVLAAPISLLFDQNVTPDIIFGSGNSNGSFTVYKNNGIELGLRAKIPFTGTLHSNGDGSYSYSLAEANPQWNFDWTVNTDYDGSTSKVISDFTYLIGIDFDPGIGTDFFTFDPITPTTAVPFYDHSLGNNGTANGAGVEATDAATYQNLIDNNNVLQQSWRHQFFTTASGKSFDPTIDGTYDIFLSAFDGSGQQVARTQIQTIIGAGGSIPEPTPLILLGLGLMAMFASYKRQSA